MTDTESRTYCMESLAGLSPSGIVTRLLGWEADGWRLAEILPYRPGNVGDIAVIEPWALLYGLPEPDDDNTCHCPACGTAHRSKGG